MQSLSNFRVGPRGGVYTVDSIGRREYLDRAQARAYIAELRNRSSLISVNPGDNDHKRSSGSSDDPIGALGSVIFAVGASVICGAAFGHPFWLLRLPFQFLMA